MTQRGWQGTGSVPAAEYDYPRRLSPGELAAAGAAGVVVGLAAFYVARIFAARTPLNEPAAARPLPAPGPSRAMLEAARDLQRRSRPARRGG